MLARRAFLLLSLCSISALAQVTITVDAAQNRRPIDPRIYGVSFADAATIADLDIPLNRWGGNTTTRYNWAISTANHARDWYFEVIPDDEQLQNVTPGQSADEFIQRGSKAIMTIPAIAYLPNTRGRGCSFSMKLYAGQMGCCVATAPDGTRDCGNGLDAAWNPIKNLVNPLDVASVYPPSHQANWIAHNVGTFGPAATTGVKYYAVDNEPDLWDSTHFDVHPNPTTYDEIWGNTQTYGATIKSADAGSVVMGPEISGWMWYFDSAYGWANGHSDQTNHGGMYFVPWLLQQAHAYEQQHGVRILDMLSLHWYPQGSKATSAQEYDPGHPAQEVTQTTKLLRNQSTRSLWDPTYVDQSWIHDLGYANNEPHLIPFLRDWVNTYYPGTKVGITEYDWGDGNNGAGVGAQVDPNGATAQADVLGIFGREGLDFANRWTSPPAGTNVYNAMKIYRNYDGAHAKFGDISVSAPAPNADVVASFAALRSSDRALTIMVINKDLTNTQQVTINLANYSRGGNVQVWQLGAANTITNVATVTTTPIVYNMPPETVNLFVVPGAYLDAPNGVSASATSTSTATVTWNSVPNATSYQVSRYSVLGGARTTVCTTGTQSCPDSGLAADTTYLYRVVATNATLSSGPSAWDAATTTMFTDASLLPNVAIKSAHITELRTAVNAMRTAANLGSATFTDPTLTAGTTTVKAAHILELRSALDQARATIGLPPMTYTDAGVPPAAVIVKSAHIAELRSGVQ